MLVKMKVDEFVEELASSSPAPGGGTIAAVSGAFAAGLGAMVCALTLGNPKYPEAQPFLPEVQEKLDALRARFLELADEDTEAFNRVMAAYKLPKETEEEKEQRKAAVAQANIGAAQVPLMTAQAAVEVLTLLPEVITHGNVNTISDCGVAMECARTAAVGALMNVDVNLPSIRDEETRKDLKNQRKGVYARYESAYRDVEGVFSIKTNGS